MSKKVNIVKFILILLIAVSVVLYITDIMENDTPLTKNLFRMLAAVTACIAGLFRVNARTRRKSLSYYESAYSKEIKNAFINSPVDRKKLLCAARLYDEDKLNKAVKYLADLKTKCVTSDDYAAVGLFIALSFTDAQMYSDAINTYEQLISMNLSTTTIYGNLGHIYSKIGETNKAGNCFEKAIELDPQNPYPYNNMAKMYFDIFDIEHAIEYAKKALEINSKVYQSATLLAIIYSIQENQDEADKYFHIAVAGGQNPEAIKQTIKNYKTKYSENE